MTLPCTLRWRGRYVPLAAAAIRARLAAHRGVPYAFGADEGVIDHWATALRLGYIATWVDGVLTISDPETPTVVFAPTHVELRLGVGHEDWAELPFEVLAGARKVLPGKPRQGRTMKLGARVSPEAARKLREHALRQGVSEACALDRILLTLP